MRLNLLLDNAVRIALVSMAMNIHIPGWILAQEHDPQLFLERSRSQRISPVIWELVALFGFDTPVDIAGCPVPEGKWEVRDGRLQAVGGDRNRAILLMKIPGDRIRIEFEAVSHTDSLGRLGDITILLGATPDRGFFNSGYALTTASYWNNCTTFYKSGRPIARTEYTPVRPGVKNRVALEFVGGHIRYWLNGEIILEAWDDTPLVIDSGTWIGIRTWATVMEVDDIGVYRGEGE